MSTSPWGYFVRYDTPELSDGAPVDVLMARTLANNVCHAADCKAAVRANWVGENGNFIAIEPFSKSGSLSTGYWYPLSTFGPWPACVRSDGTAYPLRVRLRGHSQNAAATCEFRVVYSALEDAVASRDAAGANVVTLSTSSTTAAWLTGATLLTVTEEQTSLGQRDVSVADGAVSYSIPCFMLAVTVWGKTSNASYEPRLDGFYAAEYIGL